MKKSGLIAGGAAFLFSLGAAITISPICVPCLAVLFGLLAGYLTGVFDKPGEQSRSVKTGALTGLLGGIGMLLGQILGAVINSATLGPEGTARMLAQMGFPAGGPSADCGILLDSYGSQHHLPGSIRRRAHVRFWRLGWPAMVENQREQTKSKDNRFPALIRHKKNAP